jgi:di/tricarboxylate transporter
MSESELLLIGISMILASGLVKCVEGLYHAATSKQRYWMPQVMLLYTFIFMVHFLWTFKDNLSENPSYVFYMSAMVAASTFVLEWQRVHWIRRCEYPILV